MDGESSTRSRTVFANLEMANPEPKVTKRPNTLWLMLFGFIIVIALSLATLIVVVVQGKCRNEIYQTIVGDNSTQACQTRGCILSAAHQLRWIDESMSQDRCENFFRYACTNWLRTHPFLSHNAERTIFSDILDQRDLNIQRLLDTPIIRNQPETWEYKIKNYFWECRDDYARLPDTGKTMIAVIQDQNTVNGWFLIDNSNPTDSQDYLKRNQTLVEQIQNIHGILGASTIFGVRSRFVENDPDAKRLEFYPDGLTMNQNDYLSTDDISKKRQNAFQNYVKTILELLATDAGVSDENLFDRIDTVADDIFSIETIIAKAMRRGPGGNPGSPLTTTLDEMSDEYQFNFVDLMAYELSDPSIISSSTVVYLVNSVYFQEIFDFFNSKNNLTLDRMIHNYMRWRLVQKYVEDLSYNYVDNYRRYLNEYYGYALHSSNEEYCEREVLKKFPLAIYRLYTRDSNILPSTIQAVQSMIETLQKTLLNYIDNDATWIPDEITKNVAKQKILSLTSSIGYASIASNDSLLDEYYDKLNVDAVSHFQNAYFYRQFEMDKLTKSLANPNNLDHWDSFDERPDRLFELIPRFNRLFVSSTALNEPLMNFEWPWPVQVGSLGVLLAERIFSSIESVEGRTYSANGTRIPDWWSVQTVAAYNQTRSCLRDYYVRDVQSLTFMFNGVEVVIRLSGEPFSGTTFRQIGALRVAYQSLNQSNEDSSFRMPGTNFNREQTFFLAYAQTQCYQRQDLLQIIRTNGGVYDEETALNAALRNMPEFQEAFHCSPRPNTCA